MGKTVSLWLNSEEEKVLEELKNEKNYKSIYACIKGELCKKQEAEPKKNYDDEIKALSTPELKKRFRAMTDNDKDQLRELKNSAFFYDRFYNLIHLLHNHKAPIDEFLQFTIKFKKLSMIVNEMQRRTGEEVLTWDDNHRQAAQVWPHDYKANAMWENTALNKRLGR